jgi:hypothetical protein
LRFNAWASVLMRDELHAGHALVDHVIDGVAAAAANADDLDDCILGLHIFQFE